MKKYIILITSLAFPFIAGFIGSIFTMPAITNWYAALNKPFFNPPNWLFGPVWTTLYILMGLALFLVRTGKSDGKIKQGALALFFIQLILNSFWSILFFGLRSPLLAFGEIILLWLMILLTIKIFFKVNFTAGLLLVPYILWVSLAMILNFAVVLLN